LDVIVEIGAMAAATTLAGGAADIIAAGSADAAGVALAPPADVEALILLFPIAAVAEVRTRILPAALLRARLCAL
jgi:hypothetical protein